MSTTYAGNAANNPTSITIPSDGDAKTASSVNVAFQGLMDKAEHAITGDTAFEGDKTLDGTLTVQSGGQITLASSSAILGQSGSALTMQAGSAFNMQGTATQTGAWERSGTGARTRIRVDTLTTDTEGTPDVDADFYFYTQTDNADRTHTLRKSTSPVPNAGETITVHVENLGTQTVSFKNEGEGSVNVTTGENAVCVTSGVCVVSFIYDGTKWRMAGGVVNRNFAGTAATISFGDDGSP